MKEEIVSHMRHVSQNTNDPIRPTTFASELSLACNLSLGFGKSSACGAASSALALLILYSIKSRNCVWFRNKTLSRAICGSGIRKDPEVAEKALRQIRKIAAVAEDKDPNFLSTPLNLMSKKEKEPLP